VGITVSKTATLLRRLFRRHFDLSGSLNQLFEFLGHVYLLLLLEDTIGIDVLDDKL
jgi:hypothetical protein